MGVLQELVAAARTRARDLPPAAEDKSVRADFVGALRGRDRVAVVAEFKRESPSLGALRAGARVEPQVETYARAGAAAISVLCEPTRFGGSIRDLERAAAVVDTPLLMKDFVVDERQVALGARAGASAVLLIARCLDPTQLADLAAACVARGMTPLIECHDAAEVRRALEFAGAVVGINNRNLDSLAIDIAAGEALLPLVPADRVAIAESGYERPAQVRALRGRADAALVGSALMRAGDPAGFLREVGA